MFHPLSRLLLAAALGSACQRAPKTELERGATVYFRACASCHGPDGRGAALVPGMKVEPRDLRDPALHARLDDAALVNVIREGKGQMPGFARLLGDDELAVLVPFVRSLRRDGAQR